MSGINEFVKTYLEERGYAINGRAAEIIGQADDWYRVRMTSEHKMVTVNGEGYTLDRMGFAKRAAADDANLCEVIKINAGNMENEFVQQILLENRFQTQYRKQLELTSAEGTATCYVRLEKAAVLDDGTLKGGELRLNYVDAASYLPLTVVNGEVLEAAFWGTDAKAKDEETTLVICTRDESGIYSYETVVFDKDGRPRPPETVKLGKVKPFSVMQTAEVNSIDGMEGYGYPKVYGAIPVFLALDAAFTAFNHDIRDSEKMTFINERICGFDEKGKPIPPNAAQKRRFVFLGERLPQADSLIKSEAPEIRVEEFKATIEMLLGLISMKFGYGTKKYSFENAQITTAAQYIGERQDMLQELNKQRAQARQYIEEIIRAALWFDNEFRGASHDIDTEIQVDFDDSYIESRAERLESLRQDALQGLGGVQVRALYLKEKYNLTDEQANTWAMAENEDDIELGG